MVVRQGLTQGANYVRLFYPYSDLLNCTVRNAQTLISRTGLVQGGAEYMMVVCTPSKNADEWMAEIEARKAALQ
jgi:hypothetical protein